MLLGYCLSDSEMVPVAPIITGITFAFTFHNFCYEVFIYIYIYIYIYLNLLSSFLITFLFPGIATSINMHVLFFFIIITDCDLLFSSLLLLLLLGVWRDQSV